MYETNLQNYRHYGTEINQHYLNGLSGLIVERNPKAIDQRGEGKNSQSYF